MSKYVFKPYNPIFPKLFEQETENILKQKGYPEIHIIAPEENKQLQNEYHEFGFQKGNPYRWMWKK